jgi:alpha-1,3/alpha-1,6-mannosyltransferase
LILCYRSIGDEERKILLSKANAVIYTPDKEHFGIVPLEAMANSTPVIAVNRFVIISFLKGTLRV